MTRRSPSTPGKTSDSRYQVLGTEIPRCMSLARRAPPCAVCAPATAQLLLPRTKASSSAADRADRHAEEREAPGAGSARAAAAAGFAFRRSTTSGPGSAGIGIGSPSIGASHSVPDGGEEVGERRRERVPHQAEE